jgi:uncharacterized membrane protein
VTIDKRDVVFKSGDSFASGGWFARAASRSTAAGLAISVLPILLRLLPALQRDAQTQQRNPHYWITLLGLVLYALTILVIIAHP